jgi:hypothetical protein
MATTPTSKKSVRWKTVTKTGDYTATIEDELIFADASGGAVDITIYTAVGNGGRQLIVVRTNVGLPVRLVASGGQSISGSAVVNLNIQWDSRMIVSDGANWIII